MPSRWSINLPGLETGNVKLEYLHALVSRWFDDDSTHEAKSKPYTVSPPIAAPAGIQVQVSLLDDALIERLLKNTVPGTRIRLGSSFSVLAEEPARVAEVSWEDLAAGAGRADAWCLLFLSPTTFRRGTKFTPAPSLNAILGSLRHSWRAHVPARLPALVLDLAPDPVWLTDIDVSSQVLKVSGLTVSGFTGRLRFACDAGTEVAAAVDRLVRLAPYAGVGAYTTRGFGMTRVAPAWASAPPPPPPVATA